MHREQQVARAAQLALTRREDHVPHCQMMLEAMFPNISSDVIASVLEERRFDAEAAAEVRGRCASHHAHVLLDPHRYRAGCGQALLHISGGGDAGALPNADNEEGLRQELRALQIAEVSKLVCPPHARSYWTGSLLSAGRSIGAAADSRRRGPLAGNSSSRCPSVPHPPTVPHSSSTLLAAPPG